MLVLLYSELNYLTLQTKLNSDWIIVLISLSSPLRIFIVESVCKFIVHHSSSIRGNYSLKSYMRALRVRKRFKLSWQLNKHELGNLSAFNCTIKCIKFIPSFDLWATRSFLLVVADFRGCVI